MRDTIDRFVFNIPMYEIGALLAALALCILVLGLVSGIISAIKHKAATVLVAAESGSDNLEPSQLSKSQMHSSASVPGSAEYQAIHWHDPMKL